MSRLYPLRRFSAAEFRETDGHTQPAVATCDVSHVIGGSWSTSSRVSKRIATRPGVPARALRWVRCLWLRARIFWTEDWLRDCARDGITDSLNLREFRRELEAMRVKLAILEAS